MHCRYDRPQYCRPPPHVLLLACGGTREVFYRDRWLPFTVYEMVALEAGNVMRGPAIIRDPMTTVVIPPGSEMALDAYLILHYCAVSGAN